MPVRRRRVKGRRRLQRLWLCAASSSFTAIAIAGLYLHAAWRTTLSADTGDVARAGVPGTAAASVAGLHAMIRRASPIRAAPDVSYEVHAFYYPWYCTPQTDGRYMHWNHELLPHWDAATAAKYPTGRHDPDRDDLGASFYPQLGPYSSADKVTIERHMGMLVEAGVGVAVVSWLPASEHDDNGPPIAGLMGPLLEAAGRWGIKIAVHLEPYDKRTPASVRRDVEELLREHGTSPALYRLSRHGRPGAQGPALPLLYVYDQYRIPAEEWAPLLSDPPVLRGREGGGGISIRGTPYDAVFLALVVERAHWDDFVQRGGFDGGYTYFAVSTFTFGSKPDNWKGLQERAKASGKLFVPSVGPGYDDTRVRPWNEVNTMDRRRGSYFDMEWKAAIKAGTRLVSVTSFNEWHEGTQIEPAIVKTSKDGWNYRDYEAEGGPDSYLRQNKKWVERFAKARRELKGS